MCFRLLQKDKEEWSRQLEWRERELDALQNTNVTLQQQVTELNSKIARIDNEVRSSLLSLFIFSSSADFARFLCLSWPLSASLSVLYSCVRLFFSPPISSRVCGFLLPCLTQALRFSISQLMPGSGDPFPCQFLALLLSISLPVPQPFGFLFSADS